MLAAIALAVARFIAIDSASHSASDTLRPWLVQLGAIALVAALALVVAGRALPTTPRD